MAQPSQSPDPTPTKGGRPRPRLYAIIASVPGAAVMFGYVVAYSDPDRPLVFAANPGGHDERGALKLARQVVSRLAIRPNERPDGLPVADVNGETAFAIGMRAYGQPDSLEPMPGWPYGATACEVDEKGKRVSDVGRELWPVCWLRAAASTAALREQPIP